MKIALALIRTSVGRWLRVNAKAVATFVVGAALTFLARYVDVIPSDLGPALEQLVAVLVTAGATWATRNAAPITVSPPGSSVSGQVP
jgi:hypothetical protein